MKTKLRNTWFSKLMALCLAVVMMLSMGITSFAAINPEQADIVVKGVESDNGAAVNVYKIIDVNFDVDSQQLEEPVFTWETSVANWVRTNYHEYIGKGTDNTVQSAYLKADASAIKTFLTELAAGNTLTPAVSAQTITNQTATFSGLNMGQYMIVVTKDGNNTYSPAVANLYPVEKNGDWTLSNAEVSVKGSSLTIDKDVAEGTDTSYSIGDTVKYVINADIPSYPDGATNTKFQIGDLLSAGLTLDTDSIVVKVGNTTLTEDTDYTLNTTATAEYTFLINLFYNNVAKKAADASATRVTVEYTATVNKNAFATDALGNDAFLGFTNDPFNDEDSAKNTTDKDVYTYGFIINKKAESDKAAVKATFSVFDSRDADRDALQFVKVGDGVYRPYLAGTDEEKDFVTELATTDGGKLEIQGVDLGTYYLKEVATEAGYVLPENDFTVTLTDADKNGILDNETTTIAGVQINGKNTAAVVAASKTATPDLAEFDVYNVSSDDAGFALPVTGGMGTMLFTIAGILLMGGAVALVVVAVRKRRA